MSAAETDGQTTNPVWPKADLFWYRTTTPAGDVWVKVDTEHGVKEPLFDHQRLAIELTIRSGTEFEAMTLPLADPAAQFVVKYDGSNAYIQSGAMAIEFILDGSHWRCDLQIKWNWNLVPPTDYECLSRRRVAPDHVAGPLPADTMPRVSPDGRWAASIADHNVVIMRADGTGPPVRLSSDGVAGNAYHLGSIQWSDDSRSLSATRVNAAIWQSTSVAGNVEQHLIRASWTLPAGS